MVEDICLWFLSWSRSYRTTNPISLRVGGGSQNWGDWTEWACCRLWWWWNKHCFRFCRCNSKLVQSYGWRLWGKYWGWNTIYRCSWYKMDRYLPIQLNLLHNTDSAIFVPRLWYHYHPNQDCYFIHPLFCDWIHSCVHDHHYRCSALQ